MLWRGWNRLNRMWSCPARNRAATETKEEENQVMEDHVNTDDFFENKKRKDLRRYLKEEGFDVNARRTMDGENDARELPVEI